MFSQANMPSTISVLSAYTTLAASAMVVRTIVAEVRNLVGQFIPRRLQDKIIQALGSRFGHLYSTVLTLVIDEFNGFILNEVYQASETYLRTKLTSPTVERLRVSKAPQEHNLFITVGKDQEIIDDFRGIQLKWKQISIDNQKSAVQEDGYPISSEKKCFELSFHKKHMEVVLTSYLTHVVEISKRITQENKVVKLRSPGNYCGQEGDGSINLNHPSTFDTLAMDPRLKKELMDDLDRFVKRKELYRRVGKAWKRGYLLYGPPGTGKSSLVAAMANYLKFDIFDLELATLRCNSDFKNLLTCTTNRSIIVIEDIDCSVEMHDRGSTCDFDGGKSKLTLSGLLNFIDGLWSCCGDGRIIVFTTNNKDRLDPALLRPGRMDMHIHMSYCTPCGFKLLANNYLGLQNHRLFGEIEETITEANVTPAEVAEELLRNDDAEIALIGVVTLLKRKRVKRNESNAGEEQESYQEETKRPKTEEGDDDEKEVEKQKKKKRTQNIRRSKQPTRRGAR